MQKRFKVQLPPQPGAPAGEYVVVACPKCGKRTYGVAGQKGKKCPVCRHQFPMPDIPNAPRFMIPEAACRYIQAEEAKRAGRLDFAPSTSGFRPAACAPVVAQTGKVITNGKTLDAQFLTWMRAFFSPITDYEKAGVPSTFFIAEATKAGFSNVDILIEKAIMIGILSRPRPYTIQLADPAI